MIAQDEAKDYQQITYSKAVKNISEYISQTNQELDINFNADYRLNMTAYYFEQLIPGYKKKIELRNEEMNPKRKLERETKPIIREMFLMMKNKVGVAE